MRRPLLRNALFCINYLIACVAASAADVPTPEAHLGFPAGADFQLAPWSKMVDYFKQVDAASDRVVFRELGTSTEGRPFVVAIVSSADTIARLDRYQRLQHRLADPRIASGPDEPADAVPPSKTIVLVTCTIHSTEVASGFMAMELLYELATRSDPETRERLDGTILLLVPSVNPDGVDKVARWYERTKGRPWEGDGMIELYHKYAGHDTNRDWFMLNLKETQLLTHLLYKEWFPTITYDVHQMGSKGARLFVPPFHDPINPNLDPRIHEGIALIGAHMAADLTAAGKKGVLTNAMYDNWWNGGNRTTPQRHNMVGVLTEAASVRMATPIFIDQSELTARSRGFSDHRPATNFVDPWPGGWWRLRDIVDYELICARSLLTLAARYRIGFQSTYRSLAQTAIARGKNEPPYAWVVPSHQRDPGTAAEMVRILHEAGVEVLRARSPFEAGGASYPAGSWVLPAAQPYRAHLKDMMERQIYPPRFGPNGAAENPYDVAGWTLPLQMRVRAIALSEPVQADLEPVDEIECPRGRIEAGSDAKAFMIPNEADDDFIVLNALLEAGIEVRVFERRDALLFPADGRARRVLESVLPGVSTRVTGLPTEPTGQKRYTIARRRIGVYQPWVTSMDEGWTRFVLEKFHVPYVTLHNADIRAGDLSKRIDTLVLPSIDPKSLREGYATNQTEPAYTGGLAGDGVDALREFVEEGGTLVCLQNSCLFAIESLGLPVKNALEGLPSSVFFCPGSVLAIRLPRSPSSPVTLGMPEEGSAYFHRSLAFEPTDRKTVSVPVSYATTGVLESGWLLGPEKLQGKAAVVDVERGAGHVILFGFGPQHRGQPRGTFRLLFNALLVGGRATD
jgi:hypothetical protein